MPVEKYVTDALILWATIDPISTLVLFASLTADFDGARRRRSALRAFAFSTGILLVAIVLGQLILSAMGISMLAFQVAGGIVLFVFALKLIFGHPDLTQPGGAAAGRDISVFPLAMPSIASPGAILAAIVLTDNHLHPIAVQIGTASIAIAVLLVTLLLMLLSTRVLAVIRPQGAEMLVRVMGLILAALSVQLIIDALGLSHLVST
jgi:multiple antibiotic resistance protein